MSNHPVRILRRQNSHSVRVFEKSTNVSYLALKAPKKEQGDLFLVVCQCLLNVLINTDADENVDADHVRTVRPDESEQSIGLLTKREEIFIDFRVSGLPHAVVKQAENARVRELVKKIESHPHREALQADSQQNNVHNPFSDDSKAMIREMVNVELESCETIPTVQCLEYVLCWNQGIVCCTCGHLSVESKSCQKFSRW